MAVARRFTKSAFVPLALIALGLCACTVDNAKRHYVLGEKLWTDGRYAAAVNEFEKVAARDPRGKLGTQALLRGATTQALFLGQYPEAIEKLKRYTELSQDPTASWDARKQVGDLLFTKTEQYDQALRYYQNLLQLNPQASEAPMFLFRIARSQFFLGRFEDAIATYQLIIKQSPKSEEAERAAFEIAQTRLTQGEQAGTSHSAGEQLKQAMALFDGFLKRFPLSPHAPEARFGVASCLEAMDQLDAAYQAYLAIRDSYPSRNVIEIKLERIRERKAQRSH